MLSPVAKTTVLIAICGLCLPEQAAAQSTPAFVWWPLKRTEQDSASQRSANVTASPGSFGSMVLSDGVTAMSTAYAPYSSRYGQAFAPAANGLWTAPTGPGGTIARQYYKQFSITAAAGSTVRVDSLLLWTAVYNSANGRLGISYSTNAFTASSEIKEVTGGKGPSGALAPVSPATSATGGFDSPIVINNQSGGPAQNYRFALNGSTGVTLTSGQTLTVRLYYAVGTNTAGRYALLKDVILKSQQTVLGTRIAKAKELLNVYPNPAQDLLKIAHPAAKPGSTITLYAANGIKVTSRVPATNTVSTDLGLNSLANGIYLVEYFDGQQRITSKIVKR